jgi:spermidine synthase
MSITDGWFREAEFTWPGQAMTLQVDEVLYDRRSAHQHILAFRSATYGVVLALDGIIHLTERDEHAYQEMITHLPMHCHPDPRRVLIVGGGDGGVLREVCRHGAVEAITMCEIDREVCEVSRRFLGRATTEAFDDPRLTLLHVDAASYLQTSAEQYDVIIVDAPDPSGPAETLFTAAFYTSVRRALRAGGVMCSMGECMWLHLDLIGQVLAHCATVFPSVDYAFTTIPTYPSGQIGFLVCSTTPGHALRAPAREPPRAVAASLRYYTPAVHAAAFVLPVFAEKVISAVRRPKLPPGGRTLLAPGSGAREADSAGGARYDWNSAALVLAGVILGVSATRVFKN